jgi:hypothetical protein
VLSLGFVAVGGGFVGALRKSDGKRESPVAICIGWAGLESIIGPKLKRSSSLADCGWVPFVGAKTKTKRKRND